MAIELNHRLVAKAVTKGALLRQIAEKMENDIDPIVGQNPISQEIIGGILFNGGFAGSVDASHLKSGNDKKVLRNNYRLEKALEDLKNMKGWEELDSTTKIRRMLWELNPKDKGIEEHVISVEEFNRFKKLLKAKKINTATDVLISTLNKWLNQDEKLKAEFLKELMVKLLPKDEKSAAVVVKKIK